MDRRDAGGAPTPLSLLRNMPDPVAAFLGARGVGTCEQAWDLVCRLLDADTSTPLADPSAPLERQDLQRLREQLEAILPAATRQRLAEAGKVRWTSIRPLGLRLRDRTVPRRGDRELGHGATPKPPARLPEEPDPGPAGPDSEEPR